MNLYSDIKNLTHRDFSNMEHVFYNPESNNFMSVKYNHSFETYEVWLYNDQRCFSHSFAGAENILARREAEPSWEFIGTL